MVDGVVGSFEVCGDGIDNDLDAYADCQTAMCAGDASCTTELSFGSVSPCSYAGTSGVGDIWSVEVQSAVATLEVDTVAAATVFEPIVFGRQAGPGPDWSEGLNGLLGDDEMDCTFPAANFGCAQG